MNAINQSSGHRSHRHLRPVWAIVLAASIAVGAAACGEADDVVTQPAAAGSDSNHQAWIDGLARDSAARRHAAADSAYQQVRVEALARDSLARRQAAARGSDRHLELLAAEVALKGTGFSGHGRVGDG